MAGLRRFPGASYVATRRRRGETQRALILIMLVSGCAGPPALDRAIIRGHTAEYEEAMRADSTNAGRAYLLWRARRDGISADEAAKRDAAIDAARNPFDARRDRQAVSRGAVIYAAHCARCHGVNADGRGPDVLPEFPCKDFHSLGQRLAVTLHGGAPRAWFQRISDGSGAVVNYPDGPSTAMPAFGSTLSREQIWLAVTYLQSLDCCVKPQTE